MSDRQAERAIDALYAKVPEIECKGLCQESCGPILMSRVEWKRITRRVGDAARHLRPGLTCPMLAPNGRCRVYSNRPLICRLWGVAEGMPCPWGCVPERYLTDVEAGKLLAEAGRIGA
jgi:hypothetical protein